MLSIPGIYENGEIKLLEHIPKQGRFNVIITFLEGRSAIFAKKDNLEGLLSDLNESDFNDFLECYQKRGEDWLRGREAEV